MVALICGQYAPKYYLIICRVHISKNFILLDGLESSNFYLGGTS